MALLLAQTEGSDHSAVAFQGNAAGQGAGRGVVVFTCVLQL